MIEPCEVSRQLGHIVPEQQVGRKDRGKHEKLLARQAHDCQRGFHQHNPLASARGADPGQLLHMLVNVPVAAAIILSVDKPAA